MFLIGHLTRGPLHRQVRDHRQIMVDQVSYIRCSKMFTDRLNIAQIEECFLMGLSREELSLNIHVVDATSHFNLDQNGDFYHK